MATSITIHRDQLLISLGQLQATVADKTGMLRVAGELMRSSITNTFRDEGSPAGSWPGLAESTRRQKRYTAGHKLLILSGRLRNSITYTVQDGELVIGTSVIYGRVHQYGSADRGGSIGPRGTSAYDSIRKYKQYGIRTRVSESGRKWTGRVRLGDKRVEVHTRTRHQNIPARPFLVFRPEDPMNIVSGIDAYFRQKSKAVKS